MCARGVCQGRPVQGLERTMKTILIIEDEHALGIALSMLVRRMGHLPVLVASAAAGLDELARARPAAVVVDIGLPDRSGLEVLERLRSDGHELPVLVITAHATLEHAIRAQKSGATGYLTKPLDLPQFERTLGGMLVPGLPLAKPPVEVLAATLIGAAPCLRDVFLGIARACAGDVPVLITGPGGSGKSSAAAVIHAHGPRAGGVLEFVDCSLVGGAGQMERAEGTLVLEEVTQLVPEAQRRLAEWLEGPAAGRARVVATSVHEPRAAVAGGCLREDLYYALSALTIAIPPLRERSGDIPALSAYFTGLAAAGEPPLITPPAMAALQAYQWPGNVRELRHVLDYAVSVSGGGPVFLNHLPAHVATAGGGVQAPAPGELEAAVGRWLDAALAVPGGGAPAYDELLDRIEAVMLRYLLERHDHMPTHLAAALRVNRATLRQKLRRLGMQGEG